jgi:hypothetical protein
VDQPFAAPSDQVVREPAKRRPGRIDVEDFSAYVTHDEKILRKFPDTLAFLGLRFTRSANVSLNLRNRSWLAASSASARLRSVISSAATLIPTMSPLQSVCALPNGRNLSAKKTFYG